MRMWTSYASWEDTNGQRPTRIGQAIAGYDLPRMAEVLNQLPPFWLTTDSDRDRYGGRRGLWLPGWDEYSVWGYDRGIGAYFAELHGNDGTADRDARRGIWILGRGETGDGRECVVSTTRWLACEIAAATGADLAAVVRAMLGIAPVQGCA